MRHATLLLMAMAVIPVSAAAEPTDLAAGVLIAHYVPGFASTYMPPPGWCEAYIAHYAISHHSEQNNRIDTPSYYLAGWFVLATWHEDKEFCEVEFGMADYDRRIFGYSRAVSCFVDYGIEIPTSNWPGPLSGVALVAITEPWVGNYVPVYYLQGYAYAYYGEGLIQLDGHPESKRATFTNCSNPGEMWDVVCLGGIGINRDGVYCAPPEIHVCCLEAECLLLFEDECSEIGGTWHPEWDSCTPNPCPPSPTQQQRWGIIKAMYR